MKFAVALLLLAASAPVMAESAMNGDWTVDLSSEADGSYTKVMTLKLNEDGTVTGSFYDSEILAGRWKKARGRTCVSFRTTDGQGPYHSAACLSGDEVVGQTWAEHRSFLFNWNAKRTK